MPRHIVCLTFDFDAISGFIARGQTSPSWISRGEFGPKSGAPRLVALFRKLKRVGYRGSDAACQHRRIWDAVSGTPYLGRCICDAFQA